MKNNNFGFTLLELVVVVVIVTTLAGFITLNLVGVQNNAEVDSTADTLVTDITSQQTKAMLGVGSLSGTYYGIHFDSSKYVLFEGQTYNVNDTNNFTVSMDENVGISNILFPNGNLIFYPITGTVSGFLNDSNSVSLEQLSGTKMKTITVNRYGVITREN